MKIKVLLIDDEEDVLEIIKEQLLGEGYIESVMVADSVTTAFQKLNNQVFDLVITDINMPKRSGLQVIQTIKSTPKHSETKLAILSGMLGTDIVKSAVSMGVKIILIKPLEMDIFREKIAPHFPKCKIK